jgi:uncharacterized protein YigE (DUF2233 family)
LFFALLLVTAVVFFVVKENSIGDKGFVSYKVDAKKQEIKLYWKNEKNLHFGSIENLKLWLQENNEELLFAMNGGMYKPDRSPQGLFIENGVTVIPLDITNGNGNFYLKPNGVFYITTNNTARVVTTADFRNDGQIKYATQSGPMLLIDGHIHPSFKHGSTNINIRNGVGILPNGNVVFAMSKKEINFFDFAKYFESLGCKNALYLDGLVSRTYLPEKNWIQTDGDFGVIIAVSKN